MEGRRRRPARQIADLGRIGQLRVPFPDQRSGTVVTARPDEQLAPNRPICSLLLEYIARRDCNVAACGASTGRYL